MKINILSLFALVFMSITTMQSQIDRSKQPKSGPAPKINIGKPQSFKLSNGLKVMVVENHKLPRVSINLRLDNQPVLEGKKSGVSSLTSSMLGKGSKSISKDAFNEEVDYMGANLNLGSNGGFASGLSKYFDRLTFLMADAALNPNFTEEEFQKEKDKTIEGIKSEEKNVKTAANRVKNFLVYGENHPYGEFVSKESINNVTLDDVSKHYKNYFVPENAYLVIIGDVKFKDVKKTITKNFSPWRKATAPSVSMPIVSNVQYTQVNFVDMPDAVQSEIAIVNTINLKMNDADYHAALIANKIYGGGFNSMLNLNLREANGWTYGARSSLRANRDTQATFTSSTSVRNSVTDSAVVETLKELKNIRTVDVTEKQLKNVKAKYLGDFVLAMERPQTISRYALNIETNNLPEDYYETFLEKINAVSIADVKRVANKYFKIANSRIIIVGKGSDVVENLEKVGFPINYFDKYANAVAKPVFNKAIPEGMTALDVVDNYIKAIGGRDMLLNVNTLVSNMDVTLPGAPFKPMAIKKQMMPNKISFEMKANMGGQTMSLMKRNFSGEKGYMEQQGQKMQMSEEEIIEAKNVEGIFDELYYNEDQTELLSINSIDGEDVYKVKVVKNEKTSYRYYAVESGYLMSIEEEDENKNISSTKYGDYRSVNGIMMPYFMQVNAGGQNLEFNTTEVLVNSELKDSDFY